MSMTPAEQALIDAALSYARADRALDQAMAEHGPSDNPSTVIQAGEEHDILTEALQTAAAALLGEQEKC